MSTVIQDNPLARVIRPASRIAVRNPFDQSIVAEVEAFDPPGLEAAAQRATEAFRSFSRSPSHARASVLRTAAQAVSGRREEIARIITLESGKCLRDARGEVDRCAHTLLTAAEEAVRIGGEVLPFDGVPHGVGRFAISRRFGVGPVLAITPFNFPLNLPAHKVAPAIAAGNSLLLKPSEKTPLASLALAGLLAESGLPDGVLSTVVTEREHAGALVGDARIPLVSFTGSPEVGWRIKSSAGRARVVLELGGNAATIIHEDVADLDHAIERCVAGGFAVAGQSCISVQRVLLHRPIAERAIAMLVERVGRLKTGDPLDEATDVGPLIDADAAARVGRWIRDALFSGARALSGTGEVDGTMVEPTVLTDVDPRQPVSCREVFGPVVIVETYDDFEEALRRVDDSEFGLQAGVFTSDLERALRAFEALEVGAVLVNEVPTYRSDPMPYGGVKASGLGREGIRSAIEHMTEPRFLIVTRPHRRS